MKKLSKPLFEAIPLFFILVSAFIFFYQVFLYGKIPIPADAIVGLYHPWRDSISADYPNGIPVKNILITDPVRQQYIWRKLAVEKLRKIQLPLWNPYSFSGTPLLANFQSGAFYPFNILFLFMEFIHGWTILVFFQSFLAGLFLYLYLRHLSISKAGSLISASSYMFCGFTIAWLEWNTIVHVTMWLPLILLSIDHLIKKTTILWVSIFLFAQISQVFAGHLQILFYSLCVSNLYLLIRLLQISLKQTKDTFTWFMIKKYTFFLLLYTIVIFITFPQWFTSLQFIISSSRQVDQTNFMEEGWFIPWQNLSQFLAPDFFGNPATMNYWGIWNYAELIGYIGVLPLILALYALFFRLDKKTLFFGSITFVSLLMALPTPFAKIPFILQIPFFSSSQPTRLLFVIDFALCVLAGLGFDYIDKGGYKFKNILIIISGLIVLYGILVLLPYFNHYLNLSIPADFVSVSRRNLFLPIIILTLSFLLLVINGRFGRKYRISIQILILSLILFDLYRFGWKFLPFTRKELLFPTTKVIEELKKEQNFGRILSTDRRIMPPNFSAFFKLQDVAGYDPLYLKSYNQFVAAWDRHKSDISPAAFNRIITPQVIESFLTDLLGVKYVLSYGPQQSEKLTLITTEGNTYLYQNNKAFSRVFLVETIEYVSSDQKAMEALFNNSENLSYIAVINEKVDLENKKLIEGEESLILNYEENYVRLKVKTKFERLVVLTDMYYPTWKVYVDGQEKKVIRTDFIFRGVVVPTGEHIIEYKNNLI